MSCCNNKHSLLSLLQGVSYTVHAGPANYPIDEITISEVTADSRMVKPGAMFVALEGLGVDGHDYLEHAASLGAIVLVCAKGRSQHIREGMKNLLVLEVEDTCSVYARLCANFFGCPGDSLKLIGVTGTNGKTTVTYIVEDILIGAGKGVGVVGTVNNRYTTEDGKRTILPTRFTTPEACELQHLLSQMVAAGIEYVVMEVSSHALVQQRIGTLLFDAAAFTNLSRDHLDYHHHMDEYFSAKLRLFRNHLHENSIAVLPGKGESPELADWLGQLHGVCKENNLRVITLGRGIGTDIRLVSGESGLDRTLLELEIEGRSVSATSRLVGEFNWENLLVAAGLCKALGVDEKDILQGLSSTAGAPGRLQRIQVEAWSSSGPTVFVDYAHTPDALEKVLSTVKALPHSDLYGVFGCGGDRDTGKRPVMGEIGANLCDVSIVTDDNPRTEDPGSIVDQVLGGVKAAGCPVQDISWLGLRAEKEHGCVVIPNRRDAIIAAIKNSKEGDIVVIAGKGHEPYQITLSGKKYFDDRDEAKNALLSWTPEIIARAVNGTLSHRNLEHRYLGEVVTDSRIMTDKGIFVALRGENHDAHSYAAQAAENGAACLVVERHVPDVDSWVTQVLVPDTAKALGDMAAFRRQVLAEETRPTVIGLTGSCGKTTVKEMIASILQRKYPAGVDYPENSVLKTGGNFNNLIGLPISLLPLGVDHRAAVLEMGMNVPGEIRRLAEIADPDISCITNVYGAHLLGLGSIEGVADAKEELFQGTRSSGTLIVNLDDPRIASRAAKYRQKKITFGVECINSGVIPDLFASDVRNLDGGAVTYKLHHGEDEHEIHLFITGTHNVINSLCAAAAALAAGCSFEQIALGLADFRPPDKRMQIVQSKFGFEILNDTYNANPASMAAGLRALVQTAKGKTVAVVGDMLELGDSAEEAHHEIGRIAANLKIDLVFSYGEWARMVRKGFVENGGPSHAFYVASEKDEIVQQIVSLQEDGGLGAGDLVLVKASRGLRFETIVDGLRL